MAVRKANTTPTRPRGPAVRSAMAAGPNRDDPPPRGRRTQKTSERVALEIVHDIVARGLSTGDRLPLEAEMGAGYGVSRSSLREALRILEVQGLVHIKPGPGGGPVVGSVEAAHLAKTATLYFHLAGATYDDLLRTQIVLEPQVAQLAAQSRRARTAMKPYASSSPPQGEVEYRADTVGFHDAVYALVDNPVLSLLTKAITHTVSEHVVATMDPVALRPAILAEHAALAKAIGAGQATKAERLMTEHFEAQHAHYRKHAPARLRDLIEWR